MVLHRLIQGVISLIYPPSCLHCRAGVKDPNDLLCDICQTLLELLEPEQRCLLCFADQLAEGKKLCFQCSRQTSAFHGVAAAFDYAGPAARMVRKMKYSQQFYLAEGMSAYLAAQWVRLNWEMPDLIIPVPTTLAHLILRGYNQSFLLAEGMGKLLNCPVKEVLQRKMGDYSQAGLSKKQRLELKGDSFSLRKNPELQDKCLLLIDDVMTTGSTLRHCGQKLLEGCPSKIYALTFCKAVT